jgi:hypothetical protein
MGFADQYVWGLNASTLQDDERHHATEPLCAAAVADMSGAGIGGLLSRVKFADGSINKTFESGSQNLAQLLRIWGYMVALKGQERGWIKARAKLDTATAPAFYKRVAERSLAHWLDGKCKACGGTGIAANRLTCGTCKGSKQAEVEGHGFERDRIVDMVGELEGLLQAHNTRAAARLRWGLD